MSNSQVWRGHIVRFDASAYEFVQMETSSGDDDILQVPRNEAVVNRLSGSC